MDVTELIGARPFEGSKEYAEFVAMGWKKSTTVTETVKPDTEEENGNDNDAMKQRLLSLCF